MAPSRLKARLSTGVRYFSALGRVVPLDGVRMAQREVKSIEKTPCADEVSLADLRERKRTPPAAR
jgi:hypothetical protein